MNPFITILLVVATLLTSGCSLFVRYRGTTKFEREERKASGMSHKEWENRPRRESTERIKDASGDYWLETWSDGTTKKVPIQ